MRPAAFDPAVFVTDMRDAGCEIVVSDPGTHSGPSDEALAYFIRPAPGYPAVMARWGDAIEACPDHVERVVRVLGGEMK